jgi:hypothetical protein
MMAANPYMGAFAQTMSMLSTPTNVPVTNVGAPGMVPSFNAVPFMGAGVGGFPGAGGVFPGGAWGGMMIPQGVFTQAAVAQQTGQAATSNNLLNSTVLPPMLSQTLSAQAPGQPFWNNPLLNYNLQQIGSNPLAAAGVAEAARYQAQFNIAQQWGPLSTVLGAGLGTGLTWLAGTALAGSVGIPALALGGLVGGGLGLLTATNVVPDFFGEAAKNESIANQFFASNGIPNGDGPAKNMFTRGSQEAQRELARH